MRFSRTAAIISAIPILAPVCLSLPVNERQSPPSEVLAPRATYSVVPIDGGSGAGGAGNTGGSTNSGSGSDSGSGSGAGSGSGSGSGSGNSSGGAVTVTVVQTLPPKTSFHTIYLTSPPVTDRVTDTIVVTKTVQIVDIQEPQATTTSNTSTIAASTISTLPFQSSSTRPTPTTISTSLDLATVTRSITASASVTVPLQTGFSSSSTTTHDNGMWHTSYPAWNGTANTRFSRYSPRRLQLA